MTAHLLDGKRIASQLKAKISDTISKRMASGLRAPCLAVVLVGQDPASEIYVNNKRKACAEVGIVSEAFDLPATLSAKKLVKLITTLNHNKEIDGILVQFPLPAPLSSDEVVQTISPSKDVDGFHPYNMGLLAQRTPLLRPCTPFGIIQLLNAYNLPIKSKHVVIIGASTIVGRPMGLECLLAGATVTICHRFTKNLEQHVRLADILIVATGICDLVHPSWLHSQQVVIDVGIHRLGKNQLRGDINFAEAKQRVAWITPVPGGVGPMTIATLLENTLIAAKCKS